MDGWKNAQPARKFSSHPYELWMDPLQLAYAASDAIDQGGNGGRQVKADPLGRAEGRF
jgi:hypothetical protein